MPKDKPSGPQQVLNGVISLNKHIEAMEDTLYKELESDSPDTDICTDAALNIFASAQLRIIAVDATFQIFNDLDIESDEDLEAANLHAWKMLDSIQQAYQIISDIFMKAEEIEHLDMDFSDETMSPLLEELSEAHFPEILAAHRTTKG